MAMDVASVISMGVSKNRGTPKWMVYKGTPFFLMDDLGVLPLFLETSLWIVHSSHPTRDLKSLERPNVFSYQAALSSTRENWRQVGWKLLRRLQAVWLFVSFLL